MIHTEHWKQARIKEARKEALAWGLVLVAGIGALIAVVAVLFVTVD